MNLDKLKQLVVDALEDVKAVDIKVIDVHGRTSITDVLVIASGTSDRHIKALADNVVVKAKEAGIQPLGVEGQDSRDWVLVDLNDIVVHIMLPEVRDFYNLEKLWQLEEVSSSAADSE